MQHIIWWSLHLQLLMCSSKMVELLAVNTYWLVGNRECKKGSDWKIDYGNEKVSLTSILKTLRAIQENL